MAGRDASELTPAAPPAVKLDPDHPRFGFHASARRLDPAWDDVVLARREALLLMVGAVNTTANALLYTLRELFHWLEKNPDGSMRFSDPEFLLRCVQEAIRMHPVSYGFPRLAMEDVDLAKGTHIAKDSIGMIRGAQAGLEPEFFGPDAHEFNPDRQVMPPANRHGYAFGAGSHMCFGMPIVMGNKGLDGSIVYLLKILLAAGVRQDPGVPVPSVVLDRGKFPDTELTSYPVVFPVNK